MRLAYLALAAGALPFAAHAQEQGFLEQNTYRSGGTYSVSLGSTPEACSILCGGDRYCASWSFVKVGSSRPVSRCELKLGVGAAEPDPNAVSGISPSIETAYVGIAQPDGELLGAPSAKPEDSASAYWQQRGN